MAKDKKEKRIFFVVKIGPELMEIIKSQMERIKEVTHGVVGDSVWEAGEIIAKKYKGDV